MYLDCRVIEAYREWSAALSTLVASIIERKLEITNSGVNPFEM